VGVGQRSGFRHGLTQGDHAEHNKPVAFVQESTELLCSCLLPQKQMSFHASITSAFPFSYFFPFTQLSQLYKTEGKSSSNEAQH